MVFPEIPNAKRWVGETTPEQMAQMKLITGQELLPADIAALEEAVAFYEQVYPFLQSIDLYHISNEEKDEIIAFLDSVLNFHVIVQNSVRFKFLFRVSFVREEFLENGKVRSSNYLSYPPLEIVQQIGKYGRANSPNSTCLYCAFQPAIALLETKPQVGDRIILSQWFKEDDKPFVSFPIVNNTDVENEGLRRGTIAFRERMAQNHPLFARTLNLLFQFLSSEFVKSIPIKHPKAYEYLFSAYFADVTMLFPLEPKAHPIEPIADYDSIIYPSVAGRHVTDNLAIKPKAVSRIRPVYLQEYIVRGTDYDNAVIYENEFPEQTELPISGELLRESISINEGLIVWSDD